MANENGKLIYVVLFCIALVLIIVNFFTHRSERKDSFEAGKKAGYEECVKKNATESPAAKKTRGANVPSSLMQ